MRDDGDLTKATADELQLERERLLDALNAVDSERRHRNSVYREKHRIPGCIDNHLPGECCINLDCPVHGLLDEPPSLETDS